MGGLSVAPGAAEGGVGCTSGARYGWKPRASSSLTAVPRSPSLVIIWVWVGAMVTTGGADPPVILRLPEVELGASTDTLGDIRCDSPAMDTSFSEPGGAVACLARDRRAAAKDDDVGEGGLAPAVVVSGGRGVPSPKGGTVAVVRTPLLLSTTPPPLLMLMLLLMLLLLLPLVVQLSPAAATAAAAAAAADPGGRRWGGKLGGFPLTP